MKWRVFALVLCLSGTRMSQSQEPVPALQMPQSGTIVGTVIDVNNDAITNATVVLQGGALENPRTLRSNDNGFFEFDNLGPATYHVAIRAQGFASWTSPDFALNPGEYAILKVNGLGIARALTTVTVGYSAEEIATEQMKVEEQQHILGFIPNFLVTYDPNPVPLTKGLKFQLAAKVAFNPITFIGVGIAAGAEQAGNHPNYPEGLKGFTERYGAVYANGFSDIMIAGAVLPSLLHQDPRYFHRGTGTTKSRVLYAITRPFVCKGDNGKWQPNYSATGGDLAAAAISNAYYPRSNRGPGLFLTNFFLETGERAAGNLAQEFVLRRLTRVVKRQEQPSGTEVGD